MDEKDIKILRLIQEDSSRSCRELSKIIGLPASTIYSRIKRLEKEGYIKGYQAILDEEKLGYNVRAFILASYKSGVVSQENVAREIASLPQVQGVYIIAGEWDILIEVIEKDVNSLGEFVVNRLREIKGVDKTLTCVVLKNIKKTNSLPV